MQWSVQEGTYPEMSHEHNTMENDKRCVFLPSSRSHLPAHPPLRNARVEEERHTVVKAKHGHYDTE